MLFKTLKKLFKNNKFLSYWKTLRQYFPLHKYSTYKIMWKNNWTNKRWDFTECNTVLNPGEMLPLQLLAAVYGFEIIAFYGNFCLPDQRSNKFSLATTDTKLNFLEFRSASELERITLAPAILTIIVTVTKMLFSHHISEQSIVRALGIHLRMSPLDRIQLLLEGVLFLWIGNLFGV